MFDAAPIGHSFGQVLQDVNSSPYSATETVYVLFVGANPRVSCLCKDPSIARAYIHCRTISVWRAPSWLSINKSMANGQLCALIHIHLQFLDGAEQALYVCIIYAVGLFWHAQLFGTSTVNVSWWGKRHVFTNIHHWLCPRTIESGTPGKCSVVCAWLQFGWQKSKFSRNIPHWLSRRLQAFDWFNHSVLGDLIKFYSCMLVFILVRKLWLSFVYIYVFDRVHSSPQYGAVQLIKFRNLKYMFRQVKAVVFVVC